MEIKEVFLDSEKKLVEEFLKKFDLKYANDVNKTFYCVDDFGNIAGTVSASNYIIKDLAIDPSYQGENVSGLLISQILSYFRENQIYSYQVFTKPMYKETFKNLGFRLIVETEKVVMLEGGIDSIDEEINKIKNVLEMNYGILDENVDLAAIVMNANPITNGHVYLIEEAKKNHKLLVVFIVEEDKSEFSLKERLSLAYLATRRLSNVVVIPSSKYIVSSLTFPDYFLKSETEKVEENARIDALVFKEYFMKKLFIKKRYVGTESTNKMNVYNDALKEILKDDLVLINRLEENGEVISAKRVRALFSDGKIQEAISYCPNECKMVLYGIASMKYGNK